MRRIVHNHHGRKVRPGLVEIINVVLRGEMDILLIQNTSGLVATSGTHLNMLAGKAQC